MRVKSSLPTISNSTVRMVAKRGIAGTTDTHTKTETDRDGGTTTTRETTTR